MDEQSEVVLQTLRGLFPREDIHRLLEEVAEDRMPASVFRTFVWHRMAKAAAEQIAGRKWEVVEGDLRHKAAQMAVLYTMHCIYERTARGQPDLCFVLKEAELWTSDSKAG